MPQQFEKHHLIYAKRHSIPAHLILESELLLAASFLEYMVGTHVMSVPTARRKLVAEFPHTNRLAVPKTVIDVKTNTYRIIHNYERQSVLWLIQPYEDSIREVSNLI